MSNIFTFPSDVTTELLNPSRNWQIGSSGQLIKLDVSGSVNIYKNINISGNLIVDNHINAYDISVNNLSINNTLDLGNAIIIGGSLGIINIYTKTNFNDLSFITTTSTNIQDLSSLFYTDYTPSKISSKLLISIKFNYLCSVGYLERITIEFWKYDFKTKTFSILQSDPYLGTTNATGGMIQIYNTSYLDTPNSIETVKYFIKYKLENDIGNTTVHSYTHQGIINLYNSDNIGTGYITILEF